MARVLPHQLAVFERLRDILSTLTLDIPSLPLPVLMEDRVVIGKTTLGKEEPPPVFSLLEAPRPDDAPLHGAMNGMFQKFKWHILLQGFATDDRVDKTAPAYYMKAAAEKHLYNHLLGLKSGSSGERLHPDDYLLGKTTTGQNLTAGVYIYPGVVRPATKDVSPTAFFYVPLILDMVVNLSDPYVEIL